MLSSDNIDRALCYCIIKFAVKLSVIAQNKTLVNSVKTVTYSRIISSKHQSNFHCAIHSDMTVPLQQRIRNPPSNTQKVCSLPQTFETSSLLYSNFNKYCVSDFREHTWQACSITLFHQSTKIHIANYEIICRNQNDINIYSSRGQRHQHRRFATSESAARAHSETGHHLMTSPETGHQLTPKKGIHPTGPNYPANELVSLKINYK